MTHDDLLHQFLQHPVEKLQRLVANTPPGKVFHVAAQEALKRKLKSPS